MTGNAAPPLTLASSADGIYTLTLDAPKRVNAVDIPMVQALNAALASVHAAPQARVLVLRSSSRSFCAGGDISAIRDSLSDPERLLGPLIEQFHDAILAMRRLPVPVIGSVRGAAAGGGYSLAMACDLIVASDNARFVAGYPALGTSSDGGLSHFLMRRLGSMRAMDALLLRGNSRLQLDLGRAARQFFRLVSGAMLAVYDPRRGEDRIELSTPVVTLGIRGTGVYVETDAVRAYVCTCYGAVDIATVGGTPQRERVVTTHHDAPRWVLAQPQDGQRILPAPVMTNHDDAELILLEALVGREVPFNAGDYDERPRREY